VVVIDGFVVADQGLGGVAPMLGRRGGWEMPFYVGCATD
jgi:hypothetical protein